MRSFQYDTDRKGVCVTYVTYRQMVPNCAALSIWLFGRIGALIKWAVASLLTPVLTVFVDTRFGKVLARARVSIPDGTAPMYVPRAPYYRVEKLFGPSVHLLRQQCAGNGRWCPDADQYESAVVAYSALQCKTTDRSMTIQMHGNEWLELGVT